MNISSTLSLTSLSPRISPTVTSTITPNVNSRKVTPSNRNTALSLFNDNNIDSNKSVRSKSSSIDSLDNNSITSILSKTPRGSHPYPIYHPQQSIQSQVPAISQPVNTIATSYPSKPTHERFTIVDIVNEYPNEIFDGINFREIAIISLFSRVVDLENFNDVADTLPPESQPCLYNKIGWLNAINMNKLGSRFFDLDISVFDQKEISDAIINIIVRGKGLFKLLNEKFRRNYSMPFIPGWELPASWHA
eukprot:gene20660-26787_t